MPVYIYVLTFTTLKDSPQTPRLKKNEKNKLKCSFPYYHFMVILPRSSPEQCRCSLLRTEQCQKVFEDPLQIFLYSKTC